MAPNDAKIGSGAANRPVLCLSKVNSKERGGMSRVFAKKMASISRISGEGHRRNEVIPVPEACAILGISRGTLYRLIKMGEIPAFKLSQGGRWRFQRKDLETWLEDRKSEQLLNAQELP